MTSEVAHPIRPAQTGGSAWIAPAVFAALTLVMFATVLFTPHTVVSSPGTDLVLQFLPWRAFGFGQIAKGNFPLWNPHVFGGAPYFAGFQSALLYPPNWLHLILPLGVAINWIIALHVFAAGYFTYLWCRHRELSIGGSILAGIMFMFSGPYFLHIYAGHLPHLALMPWVPLLFLSIDGCFDDARNYRWWLLGALVFATMLLAGHPQYVYYTGIAAAIYVLLNLIRPPTTTATEAGSRFRLLALIGCASIVVGGILLAAVQLFSGIQAANESVRAGGTTYEFSATFSFPPENFLTLIAPSAWGRLPAAAEQLGQPWQYFGRCYLWEVSAFIGVTGVLLAAFGIAVVRGGVRRFATTMAILTAILALGAHTPLHRFLYNYLPKFGEFRGSTKFMFLTCLFLSMLAACGFDELRARRTPRNIIVAAASLLVLLLATGTAVRISGGNGRFSAYGLLLRHCIESGGNANELFYSPTGLAEAEFIRNAAIVTSKAIFIAAATCAIVLLILIISRFRPIAAYALIALAAIEMSVFAWRNCPTTSADVSLPEPWQNIVKSVSPDDRVLLVDATAAYTDYGMSKGFNAIWGYDPGVLRRYAEVMFASQGMNPDQASQYLSFHRISGTIFSMERCALVLVSDPQRPAARVPNPMPVASLIGNYQVVPQREQMLRMLAEDGFDPRVWVALEREPAIKPAGSRSNGAVTISRQSTDMIELDANVTAPSILLITNNYSQGWRIVPLSAAPPGQNGYELMPANWTLQAIPLAVGQHRLRIEYSPVAFRVGAWVSSIAVIAYAGSWSALLMFPRSRKRRPRRRP